MPRTKLTKVAASKRARENTSELDDILRDFDVECKFLYIKYKTIANKLCFNY